MVTPAAHRAAAAHLQSAYGMSERRACRVLGVDRTSVRYQATRPDDGTLRDRLKALAQERRRFGYRRPSVGAFLATNSMQPLAGSSVRHRA